MLSPAQTLTSAAARVHASEGWRGLRNPFGLVAPVRHATSVLVQGRVPQGALPTSVCSVHFSGRLSVGPSGSALPLGSPLRSSSHSQPHRFQTPPSILSEWRSCELIFSVSSKLPLTPLDDQPPAGACLAGLFAAAGDPDAHGIRDFVHGPDYRPSARRRSSELGTASNPESADPESDAVWLATYHSATRVGHLS